MLHVGNNIFLKEMIQITRIILKYQSIFARKIP